MDRNIPTPFRHTGPGTRRPAGASTSSSSRSTRSSPSSARSAGTRTSSTRPGSATSWPPLGPSSPPSRGRAEGAGSAAPPARRDRPARIAPAGRGLRSRRPGRGPRRAQPPDRDRRSRRDDRRGEGLDRPGACRHRGRGRRAGRDRRERDRDRRAARGAAAPAGRPAETEAASLPRGTRPRSCRGAHPARFGPPPARAIDRRGGGASRGPRSTGRRGRPDPRGARRRRRRAGQAAPARPGVRRHRDPGARHRGRPARAGRLRQRAPRRAPAGHDARAPGPAREEVDGDGVVEALDLVVRDPAGERPLAMFRAASGCPSRWRSRWP
jgi:hypothetical protein